MNLHAIASPVVAAVNPPQTVTIKQSTGYTTAADGTRTPTYSTFTMQAQIQALQYNDIVQISGLNIEGLRRKVYLMGNWTGLVRGAQKGGDLIVFPDSSTWLCVFAFETWGHGVLGQTGWCSICCTLQNGS